MRENAVGLTVAWRALFYMSDLVAPVSAQCILIEWPEQNDPDPDPEPDPDSRSDPQRRPQQRPRPQGGVTPNPPIAPATLPRPILGGSTPRPRRRKGPASLSLNWEAWWDLNKWTYFQGQVSRRRSALTPGLSPGAEEKAAGGGLAMIGQGTLLVLRDALQDTHGNNRFAAAIALGKTRHPGALEPLLLTLKDADIRVRHGAMIGLGLLGQARGVSHLDAIARGTPEGARAMARGGVGGSSRAHAAFALGLSGADSASSVLCTLMHDANPRVAAFAICGLAVLGDRAVVADLCSIAADSEADAMVRRAACVALGKIGDSGPVVVRVLVGCLRDKASFVSRGAAVALGKLLKPRDREACEALAAAAQDHVDAPTACLALMSLAKTDGARGWLVSRKALKSRGLISGYAPLALAIAARSCERLDDDSDHVAAARKLLRRHGTNTGNESARRATWLALGMLGSMADVERLTRIARGARSTDERAIALTALGLIGDGASVELFVRMLRRKTADRVRANAGVALGIAAPAGAAEALTDVLAEARSDELRGACALGLGLLRDADSVERLARLSAKRRGHGDNRAFASGAIGLLSDRDDLPLLQGFRGDNVFWVGSPALRRVLGLL